MQTSLSLGARIYFRIREYRLWRRYMRRLRSGKDLRLTNAQSKKVYEGYDDLEQRQYEAGRVRTLHRGRIAKLSFKEIREVYLYEVYNQVDQLLAKPDGVKPRILEVGCGNCINAKCLLARYGTHISYTGFDLSPKRLEVSRKYWGESLADANLQVMSATGIDFPDGSFDLVFSMHVLEQITYQVGEALDEMFRVANGRVVLIEPTYEFGNPAQRLKLVLNDQLRTLLPELVRREVRITKSYALETLANPTNPTGVHVIEAK